jgi:hypothetical protein
MKERPILFSAPMVRAILDGSKTQTRRVAPIADLDIKLHGRDMVSWGVSFSKPTKGVLASYSGGKFSDDQARRIIASQFNPYGQPGDRLWVKENYRFTNDLDRYSASQIAQLCLDAGYKSPWAPIHFEADGQRKNWEHTSTPQHEGVPVAGKLRPNIFMPRWASRIDLEITGVRVERLQDISEEDAIAEGVERHPDFPTMWKRGPLHGDQNTMTNTAFPRLAYRSIWEQISGPESWDANPWVWVIEFRRIKP